MGQVTRGLLLFCAMIMSCAAAYAGSLTPPGAPGPTFKTLDEAAPGTPLGLKDVPIIITQPGFYYLKENIDVVRPDIIGIEIQASDVTVDLGGFRISGGAANASIPISPGIFIIGGVKNTVIRNGRITDFTGIGIDAQFNSAGTHVHDVQVSRTNQGAMRLRGSSIVERCLIEDIGLENAPNNVRGLEVGSTSIVSHCTVRNVQGASNGFVVGLFGLGGRIDNCVVTVIGTQTGGLAPSEATGIAFGQGSVTGVHVSSVGAFSSPKVATAQGIALSPHGTVADSTITAIRGQSKSYGIISTSGGPATIKDNVISIVTTSTAVDGDDLDPATCGIYMSTGSVTRNSIQGIAPPASALPTRFGAGIFQTGRTGAIITDNLVLIDHGPFGSNDYLMFGIRLDRSTSQATNGPRDSQVIGNRIMATESAKSILATASRSILITSSAADVYAAANVVNLPFFIHSSSVNGTVPAPNVQY